MAEEKEVIVTNDGGGSGAGMIIAVVLLIAVLVGLFLLYQNGIVQPRGADRHQRGHQHQSADRRPTRPDRRRRGGGASAGAPIPG